MESCCSSVIGASIISIVGLVFYGFLSVISFKVLLLTSKSDRYYWYLTRDQIDAIDGYDPNQKSTTQPDGGLAFWGDTTTTKIQYDSNYLLSIFWNQYQTIFFIIAVWSAVGFISHFLVIIGICCDKAVSFLLWFAHFGCTFAFLAIGSGFVCYFIYIDGLIKTFYNVLGGSIASLIILWGVWIVMNTYYHKIRIGRSRKHSRRSRRQYGDHEILIDNDDIIPYFVDSSGNPVNLDDQIYIIQQNERN